METSCFNWYYRQVIGTLRYEGLYSLLWRTMKICFSPIGFLGIVTFYQKDLTQPLREIRAKAEFTVSQATESDIEQLSTLVARRYGPMDYLGPYKRRGIRNTILYRFQRGHKCFVAKIGTEIVHYNWIFFGWEESVAGTGCFIHLRNDEAFFDDAYTVEEWRGKGIHTAVQNQMLLFLHRVGYRRVYTDVPHYNKSSLKTHHRLSWEFSGTMLYFIPRGREKAWIWRICGTLDPFVNEQTRANEA